MSKYLILFTFVLLQGCNSLKSFFSSPEVILNTDFQSMTAGPLNGTRHPGYMDIEIDYFLPGLPMGDGLDWSEDLTVSEDALVVTEDTTGSHSLKLNSSIADDETRLTFIPKQLDEIANVYSFTWQGTYRSQNSAGIEIVFRILFDKHHSEDSKIEFIFLQSDNQPNVDIFLNDGKIGKQKIGELLNLVNHKVSITINLMDGKYAIKGDIENPRYGEIVLGNSINHGPILQTLFHKNDYTDPNAEVEYAFNNINITKIR